MLGKPIGYKPVQTSGKNSWFDLEGKGHALDVFFWNFRFREFRHSPSSEIWFLIGKKQGFRNRESFAKQCGTKCGTRIYMSNTKITIIIVIFVQNFVQSAAVNRPPSIGLNWVQIGPFFVFLHKYIHTKNRRFKAKNGRFKAKTDVF